MIFSFRRLPSTIDDLRSSALAPPTTRNTSSTKRTFESGHTPTTTKEAARAKIDELKKQAKAMGLDTQKFIRISLESIIRKKAG
jgi:predicted DNA binding CopG/RHH family protein